MTERADTTHARRARDRRRGPGHDVEPRTRPEVPLVSLHLARWLQEAGLAWEPAMGDQFMMPDHEVDRLFRIADMVVEVRRVPAGRIIAFNGTPEWALDDIMLSEALWLPTEAQLRALLGDRFTRLDRDVEGWAVTLEHPDDPPTTHRATTSVDAHARALLSILRGRPT